MDILFLLKPTFSDKERDDGDKHYYCPDCAFIEGVLSYYPRLREQLDIRYIDFPKPRKEIVKLVGGKHQGCPNLILDTAHHSFVDAHQFKCFGDKLYTTDPKLIVQFFSDRFDIPEAHY